MLSLWLLAQAKVYNVPPNQKMLPFSGSRSNKVGHPWFSCKLYYVMLRNYSIHKLEVYMHRS